MAQSESSENQQKSAEEKREELHDVADKAQDVLIRAESIFPFVLFPDTISVSRMKVAITKRAFFKVAEVVSLQIEDILNIEIDTGPFFGSLKIYTRIYGSQPLKITFLSRRSAVMVKRIIEGLLIAAKQQMDITDLERKELLALLKRLGTDEPLT